MAVATTKPLFHISMPTRQQTITSVERVTFVFFTVFLALWLKNPHPFTEAAIWAAISGGASAIYSLVKSVLFTV